jgi:MFS family permease
MQMDTYFPKIGISLKAFLGNIIATVCVVVWYTYAYALLESIVETVVPSYFDDVFICITTFETIITIILGSLIVGKVIKRKSLLLGSALAGAIASLMLAAPLRTPGILILTFLFSISLGISLPAVISIFKEITREENRGRLGSIMMLSIAIGIMGLRFLMSNDMFLNSLILTSLRFFEVVGVLLLGEVLEGKRGKSPSFSSILGSRSVLLYFFPWVMFSLVNYLGWPVIAKIHGSDFVSFLVFVGNIVTGVSALLAGFVADIVGRKRTLIFGFIIFGLGYALLGIFPFNAYVWQFYAFVDGFAWGIFYVLFFFTIWGDLAHEKSSEKFYAIGIIPYILSDFLRETFGPLITEMVSEYAIFSFAAFFLFLAVVPLMFAPETLPEKALRERELRSYIEKAKRVREKFTKG